MNKIKKIYAATIGLGFGLSHAKVFKKNKYTELVCVNDLNKRKKKLAKSLKTNFTQKTNSIFDNKKINLVSIASYDNYHFQHLLKAIINKKNIFIEKPICQNSKQLNLLKKLLKNTRLKLSSNFVLRYHPKFKKVKELINQNKIGKIYSIEGEYNYGRLEKLVKGWRGEIPYYSIVQGGGIHIIDLMQWLTNSFPQKVISVGNNLMSKQSKFRFNDNNIALLTFKNGVIGKVTSNFSCTMPHNHYLKIYGKRGTIEVSFDKIFWYKSRLKKSKPVLVKYKKDKNYKDKLLNSFIESIFNKKKNYNPTLQDIYSSLSTCFAIDKSLKSKKWEKVI